MAHITYGDLVLIHFDPTHPRNIAFLFRDKPHGKVRNIFRPGLVSVGKRLSVKHGTPQYIGEGGCSQTQWSLISIKSQKNVSLEGNQYQFVVFESIFMRNGLRAIPHKEVDRYALVTFRDVWELFTESGMLNWGYAGEREIVAVLNEVKKGELGTEYAS